MAICFKKPPWWSGFYECLVDTVTNSLKTTIGKALCTMNNQQLIYVKLKEQLMNDHVTAEIYEKVSTPYHMIFGRRNINDKCTISLYEMRSDNVRAYAMMQRKLSIFKYVLKHSK